MTEIITGVGFGVGGPDETYLQLVDDDGSVRIVQAGKLVPEAGRCAWEHIEALTDGFEPDFNAEILACDSNRPRPLAYRVRITVEAEPLSEAETTEILERVKAWRAKRRQEP